MTQRTLGVVLVMVLFGCGQKPETVCEPGRSLSCVGPGGCVGGQQCNADGTAWGACECGSSTYDAGHSDGGNLSQGDAGSTDGGVVDPTCGLDCNAQGEFGLTFKRCFEFSSSPSVAEAPQTFAIYVKGTFMLEGNVQAIEVDYLSSGQIKGQDFFTLPSGTLTLVRRISSGSSATYLLDGGLDGVQWLPRGTAAGAQIDTTRDERLSGGTTVSVDYRVTTGAAAPSDLTTLNPAISIDGGFLMGFNTTPAAKSDAQRVFAPGVGFTRVTPSTSIIASGATYYLQNIRDLDAGSDPCSLGPVP